MALRRIFRNSPILNSSLKLARGGGWERPDVPLPKIYEDRRYHKVEDIGEIWIDKVQPEFYLSDNEVNVTREGGYKEVRLGYMWMAFIVGLGCVFTKIFLPGRQLPYFSNMMDAMIADEAELARDRPLHKKTADNPLGLKNLSVDTEFAYRLLPGSEKEGYHKYSKVHKESQAYLSKKYEQARAEVLAEIANPNSKSHH